ncbi:family 78 glycoside hydrolase catalytic domain [Nonomuraea sp. NPDC050310]|uniref:family 78 glycoside hydrolase catalytic domain n=1 Tax=Nonomuraea sp. NPDC050310 TaxID=3154935 RepID=UPI0033FD8909
MDLRVEGEAEPLGLDAASPAFSWRLAGEGRGRTQRGYRITVKEEGRPGSVWDSGPVSSDRTYGIAYGGAPLRPRTRYHWRVRVADERGTWSEWSPWHWFETGLGDTAGWTADWIGAPEEPFSPRVPTLESVPYIWVAGEGGPSPATSAGFRARVTVPCDARPLSARLVAGGAAQVHLNGAAADGETVDGAFLADVGDLVGPGENVLAVRAVAREGRPGGVCARLEVVFDDRVAQPQPAVTLTSDGRWRGCAVPADGFERPGFDDSAWPRAEQVGLHGDPPWGREPVTDRPSPYLRAEFDVPRPVRRARLYASALGVYELHLNGSRVGADHLAPGWTDYRHRITYQSYDVTALIAEGGNALGAVLADGWYAGHVGWLGPFQYGRRPALRAELHLVHDDGSITRVMTGTGWRTGSGAIRYADLQNGERQDLTAEPQGWTVAGFDDSAWAPAVAVSPPSGTVTAAVAPPIRVHQELEPVRVWQSRPGVWMADFGQNVVGWVRLTARASRERPVIIRHAEVLEHDGELHLANLRSARSVDEFVATGGPHAETFEPRFTFHGFRYAEISGLAGPLTPEALRARVAHAAMTPAGEFACSDERLNQLQRNIVWGLRGNFLSVPTDCPQRDERLGWTGDIWAFAPTALFNYDVRAFLRSWLVDVVAAQSDDGAISFVAPDVLSGRGDPKAAGSPGWGDAIVLVPWAMHRLSGDIAVVEACYEPMRRWLDYLDGRACGGVFPDEGFGDWLSLGAETPKPLVGTAITALSARQFAELAAALDRPEDERAALDLYTRTRQAFRAEFVSGPGELVSGTQTAYALAIAADLFEEPELTRAGARLARDVEARGWHLSTGFLGTPYLLDALTRTGHLDVAYRLLTQESFPSWLHPIVHGDATTMWERWDGWSEHRGLQDPGMNSFNHYAYGAVGDWMYRTIGGLVAAAPGYRHLVVRPRPGGGITWATTTHRTPHGPVEIAWRAGDSNYELDVTVPPTCTAEVWVATEAAVTESGLPAERAPGVSLVRREEGHAVFLVGSGSYSFRATSG